MLGEVDCGYLLWYRSERPGLPVAEELHRSLTNYFAFLEATRALGHEQVIVCAVPPPTILDGQVWGDVANARSRVTATLRERTDLTHRYNQALRAIAYERGFSFLDFEAEVIDPASKPDRHELRNPDPLDHHLADGPLAAILLKHLLQLGYR